MPFLGLGVLPHVVETSTNLTTWTEQPAIQAVRASVGCNNIVGDATLQGWTADDGSLPGSIAAGSLTQPDVVGQWVRIRMLTPTPVTCFVGSIDGVSIGDGGALNRRAYEYGCTGIAAQLMRMSITDGYEIDSAGSTAVALGRCPKFNDGGGNRSSGLVGPTYVFDRRGGGSVWTIKQALDHICGLVLTASGAWEVTDHDSILAVPMPSTIDPDGMTMFDLLNAVCGQRRGAVWYVSVNETTGTCTINVRTTGASASLTKTLALTGLLYDNVSIITDAQQTTDEIIVDGAQPWTAITLRYTSGGASGDALEKGWESADETAWDAGDRDTTGAVWRTFRLRSDWEGNQAGETTVGVREGRTLDVDNQLTGARAFDSVTPPLGSAYALTAETTAAENWGTDADGPRMMALAWAWDGSSTYVDLCSALEEGGQLMPLTVSGNTITIGGTNHQAALKDYLDGSGKALYVTIGIREQRPFSVSWRRASPPRQRRTLKVRVPDAELWTIAPQTWKDVNGGTPTKSGASVLTVRTDLALLQSYLDDYRAWFDSDAVSFSFVSRGYVDADNTTAAIGQRISSVTTSAGGIATNTVVTQKVYTFTDAGYGTAYTTARIMPDIGALL